MCWEHEIMKGKLSGAALTEGSVPTLIVTELLEFRQENQQQICASGVLGSRGSCHWVWLHMR